MKNIAKITLIGIIGLVLAMYLSQVPAYAETLGTDILTINLPNGDVPSTYQMSMKIYQDFNTNPYRELDTISDIPFAITALPLNHNYKIEVYVNGISVGVGYINFQSDHQADTMNISYSSGMLVYVFYKDGVTPIPNALVNIQGQDNTTWASSITDANGKTKRFYLSPTIKEEDSYKASIVLGPTLSYTFSPLKLISRDTSIKIVTPWPSVLDQLITLKLYESNSVLSTNSGIYVVRATDGNKNTVAESNVNSRAEAYFSNLKVGYYLFQVVKSSDNSIWGSSDINLDGSKYDFIIMKNQISANATAPTPKPIPTPTPVPVTPPVTKPIITNSTTNSTSNPADVTSALIPLWIKNNAGWWSQGQIENNHFFQGIQYLIQSGKIKIPETQSVTSVSHNIPVWFKNNAGWWSTDLITDNDFIKGTQFLIDKKIIN